MIQCDLPHILAYISPLHRVKWIDAHRSSTMTVL